jgi:hypothetical protein
VLRAAFDWLLMRDLDARRTALRGENNDLDARVDDLERRVRRFRDYVLPEVRRQMDDRHALNEQLLAGATAGDTEMLSRQRPRCWHPCSPPRMS